MLDQPYADLVENQRKQVKPARKKLSKQHRKAASTERGYIKPYHKGNQILVHETPYDVSESSLPRIGRYHDYPYQPRPQIQLKN